MGALQTRAGPTLRAPLLRRRGPRTSRNRLPERRPAAPRRGQRDKGHAQQDDAEKSLERLHRLLPAPDGTEYGRGGGPCLARLVPVVHQFEIRGSSAAGPRSILPPRLNPVCAECGKPILPTNDKTIVKDVRYDASCWDRKTTRNA